MSRHVKTNANFKRNTSDDVQLEKVCANVARFRHTSVHLEMANKQVVQ